MIDHIIITVSDYNASRAFYVKALEPLGYSIIMEFGKVGSSPPLPSELLWRFRF